MVNEKDELVVVDFKATAREKPLNTPEDVFGGGATYKRQLEITGYYKKMDLFQQLVT